MLSLESTQGVAWAEQPRVGGRWQVPGGVHSGPCTAVWLPLVDEQELCHILLLPCPTCQVLSPRPPRGSLPYPPFSRGKLQEVAGPRAMTPSPLCGEPGTPSTPRRHIHLSDWHSMWLLGSSPGVCNCWSDAVGVRGCSQRLLGMRGCAALERAEPGPLEPSSLQKSLQASLFRKRLGTRAAYEVLSSTAEGDSQPQE